MRSDGKTVGPVYLYYPGGTQITLFYKVFAKDGSSVTSSEGVPTKIVVMR